MYRVRKKAPVRRVEYYGMVILPGVSEPRQASRVVYEMPGNRKHVLLNRRGEDYYASPIRDKATPAVRRIIRKLLDGGLNKFKYNLRRRTR